MRLWRMLCFWGPALVGLLVAGGVSDVVTDGWAERQALGWVTIIVLWPVVTGLMVPVFGFVAGLVGYRPYEQTTLFGIGWDRGQELRQPRPTRRRPAPPRRHDRH